MKLNSVVRSILKTAVYLMDQTADTVDRASSRASEMAEDAREAFNPGENHTMAISSLSRPGLAWALQPACCSRPPVEPNCVITSATKCRKLPTESRIALMPIP